MCHRATRHFVSRLRKNGLGSIDLALPGVLKTFHVLHKAHKVVLLRTFNSVGARQASVIDLDTGMPVSRSINHRLTIIIISQPRPDISIAGVGPLTRAFRSKGAV